MGVFMRDTDAFTWYMEKDPILRSTVVAVAWLDRSPDWDVLVARLERASRLLPILRQRVLVPPVRLATPRWTVDALFDLTWHLRRIDSPAPHTPDTVVAIARSAAMTAFDRSFPLWEFTLVEHLVGERAALVMKMHHSLTDGLGAMQLAPLLFDLHPTPSAPTDEVEAPAGERFGTVGLIRASLVRDLGRTAGLVRFAAGTVACALGSVRHPIATVGEVVETARSIARTVAPVLGTLSPIMKSRSLGRHLEMLEVGLDDLARASAVAGGTVNDAFMAAVTGGLSRYHDRHEVPVDALRVTMPISIRRPSDPIGGNRITLMRFAVPVSDPDPAVRIREIGRLCRDARSERSLPFTNAIAGSLNLMPSGVVGSMLKHVDFLASDVPGLTSLVHLAGAQVERYSAFGPTTGSSVNFTLVSYGETCCVGITIDTAAVPDPDVLIECFREGFEEVLDLGGAHNAVHLPLHDDAPAVTPPSSEREESRGSERVWNG
jgi:diacylglycerol O-acyltransferase